jgi:hypothetical protein
VSARAGGSGVRAGASASSSAAAASQTLAATYGVAAAAADNTIALATGKGGIVIDNTAAATLEPLLVKNALATSGIAVQAVGAIATGYLLRDTGGTRRGFVGLAAAAAQWGAGAVANDVVIGADTAGVRIRGAANPGVKIATASNTTFGTTTGGYLSTDDAVGTYVGWGPNTLWMNGADVMASVGAGVFHVSHAVAKTSTSATSSGIRLSAFTVAPTSGAAEFRALDLTMTVNQTGTSSGACTGIYSNIVATATLGALRSLWLQKGGVDVLSIKPAQAAADMVIDWNTATEYSDAIKMNFRLAGAVLGTIGISSAGQSFSFGAGTGSAIVSGAAVALVSGQSGVLVETGPNVSINASSGSYGGGVRVAFVANRTTAPTSNPAGGGILYAEAGALKWRGSSGTTTTLGVA